MGCAPGGDSQWACTERILTMDRPSLLLMKPLQCHDLYESADKKTVGAVIEYYSFFIGKAATTIKRVMLLCYGDACLLLRNVVSSGQEE
jgi:hypothetical protein